MNSSDFIRHTEQDRGTSYTTYVYDDPSTGRSFSVREINGPTSIESAVGKALSDFTVRYFAEEFKPNGRLVKHAKDISESQYIDIPRDEWSKAKQKPSTALATVEKHKSINPGFLPILMGGGLGIRTIFFADLCECARAITNAIDADYWQPKDRFYADYVRSLAASYRPAIDFYTTLAE